MYNVGIFLVLFRRHPHLRASSSVTLTTENADVANLLERVETCQNGTTNPRRVLAFWRGVDFDLHVFQRELLDLVQEAVTKTCDNIELGIEQSGAEHVPRHSVLPPLRTIFENKLLRRSRSTLLMASTTT